MHPPLQDALEIFRAALAGIEPAAMLRRCGIARIVADAKPSRIRSAAFGKSAIPMALAFEAAAGGIAPIQGLAVAPHGSLQDWRDAGRPLPSHHELIGAGHPIPDEAGVAAGGRVLELARSCREGELFVALISGGGSALLPAFADGLALADAQAVFGLLLRSGAAIGEVNCVRKHLSRIGGGRLAQAAAPAQVLALAVSDVPGDDLSVIASGPTVPDPTTFADARDILERFELPARLPAAVLDRIRRGMAEPLLETPKPGDPVFEHCRTILLGGNATALDGAAERARALGYVVSSETGGLYGEARDAGRRLAEAAIAFPSDRPFCFIAGGETTVVVRGAGQGGRNQEFALGAAQALAGAVNPILILSCGTDGIDGPTDAAGAWATSETIAAARAKGLDSDSALAENNTYPFFDALGQLVRIGPTHVNVADIAIALIGKK